MGARALRDVAADLRRAGATMLAADSDRDAEVLERLGQRATVAAARDHGTHRETELPAPEDQAYGMYEALTDPVDRVVREHEAEVSGQLVPSDQELRAEFDQVCRELGLRDGPESEIADAEQEAER
jgi:hypothetical protein